jgi:hypothetical protein
LFIPIYLKFTFQILEVEESFSNSSSKIRSEGLPQSMTLGVAGGSENERVIEALKGIGVNLSHIVLVIRHFVLIFSFSGMILF